MSGSASSLMGAFGRIARVRFELFLVLVLPVRAAVVLFGILIHDAVNHARSALSHDREVAIDVLGRHVPVLLGARR